MGIELLECISRLHIYCIDMKPNDLCSEIDGIIPVPISPLGWGYLPVVEPLHVPAVSGTSKVCDAVYTLSDKCITPFTGSQWLNPTKDACKYFLSQVWIRIEMVFGLLTTKWQILKNHLGISLHVGSELLECISRLHNYCIEMRSNDLCSEIDEFFPVPTYPLGWGYLPTVEPLQVASVFETSKVCDAVLSMVSQNGFGRPAHNLERHR